jgi:hypothetical protein
VRGEGRRHGHDLEQIVGNAAAVTNNITIQNCSATGFSHCGIYVNFLTGGATLANLTITGCTMNANAQGAFNGGAGIFVRGPNGCQISGNYSFSNVTVSNCTANNNPGGASASWSGSGIQVSQTNVGTITGCVAGNNSANYGSGGIWCADSKFLTIQFCESYGCKTTNIDGVGYDIDEGCDNCTIQYCLSHGNAGAGYYIFTFQDVNNHGSTNNTIRYCVSMNDCQYATTTEGAIHVVSATSSPQTNFNVYGNTIYMQSRTPGQLLSANAAALKLTQGGGSLTGTVANNIFVTNTSTAAILTTGGTTVGGVTLTGNCYWANGSLGSFSWNGTSYSTFAAWQTATGQEKILGVNVGVNANPLIVNPGYDATNATSSASQKNSFKLQSGSPCLGAGVNLQVQYGISAGGRDYYGKTVTDGGTYDIGSAYGAAVLGGTVTVTFTDHAEDATGLTTYTWAGKAFAIGTADPTRLVTAYVTGRASATTTATCTGVTIGGVAATLVTDGRNTAAGNLLTQSAWQALVPTGTTATISATFSTAFLRAGVAVFSVTGSSGDVPLGMNVNAIASTDNSTVDPSLTTTVVVPAQGAIAVGGALGAVTGTPTITPTNFTTSLAPTALGTSWHTVGKDATSGIRAFTQAWGGTSANTPTGAFAAWMPTIT